MQVDVKMYWIDIENSIEVRFRNGNFSNFMLKLALNFHDYSRIIHAISEYAETVHMIVELFPKHTYEFGISGKVVRMLFFYSETICRESE